MLCTSLLSNALYLFVINEFVEQNNFNPKLITSIILFSGFPLQTMRELLGLVIIPKIFYWESRGGKGNVAYFNQFTNKS